MQTCDICKRERYNLNSVCDPCLHRFDVIEQAFMELRKVWFDRHLASRAHEREWEDADHELLREQYNDRLREKYDRQTQEIIDGAERSVAPTCAADLEQPAS